jgi:hypothetical protein
MDDGVAGYAYKPQSVSGSPMYKVDGIMIRHDYIGSIGTGSPARSRALTHEIGHYLGLDHPWGPTNQPGVACGDDGIMDTPGTKGWTVCNLNGSVCLPPIIENVQNFMEYAYCSNMFTNDQKTYMRNILNNSVSDRKLLWEEFNLIKTGTNDPYTLVNNCAPKADFSTSSQFECTGNQVLLTDRSFNGTVTSRLWTIQDGNPSTATTPTVNVTFNTPGWKVITLEVSNDLGSSSVTKTQYLYISQTNAGIQNFYDDFESIDALNNWQIVNTDNNNSNWTLAPNAGYFFSKCIYLNAFGNTPGDYDYFVTPSMDLSSGNNAYLRFKVACATRASNTLNNNMNEELRIYSSTNCGKTWAIRKTLKLSELINAGFYYQSFFPTSLNEWREHAILLPASIKTSNVKFKFEYVTGNKSNNIYIDDINVSNFNVGIDEALANEAIKVFPNPAAQTVYIETAYFTASDFIMNDVTGRTVSQASYSNSLVQFDVSNLADGIYFIRNIKNGSTTKVVVKN